jgi:hypothetical protein
MVIKALSVSSCQLPVQNVALSATLDIGRCRRLELATVNWKLIPSGSLPTTLRDSRDVALQRQFAETETAQRELAEIPARPPASPTPVAVPHLELQRLLLSRDLRRRSHLYIPSLSSL